MKMNSKSSIPQWTMLRSLLTASRRLATGQPAVPGVLLALLVCLAASSAKAFVYDTWWELQSDGDFDGDGRRDLVLVDKSTGDYRLGYQLAPGVITWVTPRASGITGATGLGIGKLNSTNYDSLAFTGPEANRINLLDATNAFTAGLPRSAFIASLGPNAIAALDIPGPTNTPLADFYVASLYNGVSPYRATLVRNSGGTNQTPLSDYAVSYGQERVNAVLLHTNRAPGLALFHRNPAGSDFFNLFNLSSGAAVSISSVLSTPRTPQPWEYVTGQFAATNAYTQVLLYPPTATYFYVYQLSEPTPGTYALGYVTNYTLGGYPIDRIIVVPSTNGNRLLFFNTNGASAALYAFNGRDVPTLVQSFTASAGEHFTGAGTIGPNGFLTFSAPLGEGVSTKFKQWMWTGSAYSNTVSGDLPRLSEYTAAGNVMQFRYEPFVTNNPILLRLNNAGDWSSSVGFSGLPGNISVLTESYLSATQGLANPTPLSLGSAHPLAAFGLANQFSNMISLFSFNAPAGDRVSDIILSPPPGLYPTAVKLQFSAATATDTIRFRYNSGPWQTWSNGLLVQVFTNSTIQYYGQPASGAAKSAVKSALYTFSQGPATLDSKGDGIPDYVKVALGLPLTGSRDTDGDGYSDLEELIHGTNPFLSSSVPTNYPHLDDQAVFDLKVKPVPWDGFANAATLSATGTVVRVLDFQGSLLGVASADTNNWPEAAVTNVILVAEDRLASFTTEQHYDLLTTNTDTKIGREMIGMVAVPPLQFPAVPYVYAGGNITNEALNWIASASNTFNHLPRASLSRLLTFSNTLESLLFELKTAQLLAARSNSWWTNLTLFPYRVSDLGRTNPPQSVLLDLESATTDQPGYKLQTLFATISTQVETSSSAPIASLRAVVQDIYRIDSRYNNSNPATFASPVDEIRYFLWNGTLDTNYLPYATTASQFGAASTGAVNILMAVPPRPTTNVFLTVRMDTLGSSCRLLDLFGGGATFALFDSSGLPFSFPDNFQLLPGTVVQISGYTDLPSTTCGYPAIEVTSALLTSVPVATDTDSDGNLLIDTWEKRFFGYLGVANPFADADDDGYSNLQEMLDQSDPRDFYGRPATAPVNFGAPVLSLKQNLGQVELHFKWPSAYLNRFNFGVRHTADLTAPFVELPVSLPVNVSGDEFKVTFAQPPTSQHYYYLTVSLK